MIVETYTHPDAPSFITKLAKLDKGDHYQGFNGEGCVRVDIDSAMTIRDEYDADKFEVIAEKLKAKGWVKS